MNNLPLSGWTTVYLLIHLVKGILVVSTSWKLYIKFYKHPCAGFCVDLSFQFGEGNGTPLQYSCLVNPMDGGAWWAADHGVAKSQTRLSNFTFIGEGNGNPLQCSCLENPRDRGAWWAAVYGVTQSWTRLKRLSSSSKFSVALDIYQGGWLLDHMVGTRLVCKKAPECPPKWLHCSALPPAMTEGSCCSTVSPAFGVVSVWTVLTGVEGCLTAV